MSMLFISTAPMRRYSYACRNLCFVVCMIYRDELAAKNTKKSSQYSNGEGATGKNHEVHHGPHGHSSGQGGVLDVCQDKLVPVEQGWSGKGRDAGAKKWEHRVDDHSVLVHPGWQGAVEARPEQPQKHDGFRYVNYVNMYLILWFISGLQFTWKARI